MGNLSWLPTPGFGNFGTASEKRLGDETPAAPASGNRAGCVVACKLLLLVMHLCRPATYCGPDRTTQPARGTQPSQVPRPPPLLKGCIENPFYPIRAVPAWSQGLSETPCFCKILATGWGTLVGCQHPDLAILGQALIDLRKS